MTALKALAAFVGVIIIVVVISVAGWQFGWWLKAKNVTKQGQVFDRSYNHQVALRQEVQNYLVAFDTTPDMTPGQRARFMLTVCDAIDTMLDQYKTDAIRTFEITNC